MTSVSSPEPQGHMTFWDHLEELRARLIKVLIALVVAMALASLAVEPLLKYLIQPCDCNPKLLSPTDGVIMYFRVLLMTGAIMIIPYITYQVWMFVLPALEPKETRMIYMALPVTTLLFLLGVSFAWFVMIPTAIPFLQNFMGDVFDAEWTANEYIAFLTSLLFWMGVAFEMPIVFFVLARMGFVSHRDLIQNWRFAIVGMTIIAAVITPTVDPFNMLIVVAPLMVLYILSILLTAIAYRQRTAIEHIN